MKGDLKLPNECCYLTAPWLRDSQVKVVPWTNDSALNSRAVYCEGPGAFIGLSVCLCTNGGIGGRHLYFCVTRCFFAKTAKAVVATIYISYSVLQFLADFILFCNFCPNHCAPFAISFWRQIYLIRFNYKHLVLNASRS